MILAGASRVGGSFFLVFEALLLSKGKCGEKSEICAFCAL